MTMESSTTRLNTPKIYANISAYEVVSSVVVSPVKVDDVVVDVVLVVVVVVFLVVVVVRVVGLRVGLQSLAKSAQIQKLDL